MADDSNERRAGGKAMTPQEAEAQAVRDKIARLRALRLAQEVTQPNAGKTPARASTRKKQPPAKSTPLADWLSAQDQQGRRK
jgi:hypothetical protein